jgi:hypothetical protein
MNETYSKNPDIIFRTIAGEYILVPIRQKAVDLKSIFTLNEVAAFIWELIDNKAGISLIKEKLAEEFEVEATQAEADIAALVSQLESLGFIRKT